MSYNFFVKSNIDFGRGALGDLAQILQGYQMKSAMIVYDGGVKAAGIADKVVAEVVLKPRAHARRVGIVMLRRTALVLMVADGVEQIESLHIMPQDAFIALRDEVDEIARMEQR